MSSSPPPDGPVPDDVLIERARRGDEDAFADLFARHASPLEAKIRRGLPPLLNRRVSVSDVAQEVRIVAFERIGQFEPRGPNAFRHWLQAIAANKIGTAMKRHLGAAKRAAGAEVTRGHRPETHGFQADGPSPSEMAMRGEDRRSVRQTLSLLPEDYAHVLTLVFEQQLTLREVSERVGRSYEATKKLYGRALSRFAAVMDQRKGKNGD